MVCNKNLSIIIPVYKTEKYLPRCLDSVLAAYREDMEVLVINDGSPDESEKIITDYRQRYPDIFSYYKKDNGGLSDAKNYGLKRARGEYVIFLDSDDFVEPGMYREMLELAKTENADAVICDIYLDYEEDHSRRIIPCTGRAGSSVYHRVMDTWLMPASWNKMVKSDLYCGLDFPVGYNNEDVCVTPIVLTRAKQLRVIHKPYYHYVQRQGSIQNSGFSEKRFVILEMVKLAIDRMKEEELWKQQLVKDTLYFHQILSMAMYPIREIENMQEQERMLTVFMERTYEFFPDFMEVHSFLNIEKMRHPFMKWYWKISIKLLDKRHYHQICRFWKGCNIVFLTARKIGLS